MSQNAKSVRSALQTLISPFHNARSSKEFPVTGNYNPPGGPQERLIHLCPVLTVPTRAQGRQLFSGETGNMQTAKMHDQAFFLISAFLSHLETSQICVLTGL